MPLATTVSVTTGGTLIIRGSGNANTPRQVRLYNNGAVTVHLQGSTTNLNSTSGYPLFAATEHLYDLYEGEALWGIATAGCEVRVISGRNQ
jgi:hypothetical protein